MKKQQIITSVFLSVFCLLGNATAQVAFLEDLLYWHASQQSTSPWAYVQTTKSTPFPANTYTEPNVYFKWSPGLKLGLRYTRPNFFDAKLYWTHFSTKTHEAIQANSDEIILPEFFNGFLTELFYNNAQLSWKLGMNMLDAELGHRFKPLKSLSLRPFIGIKGGTINQSIYSSWQLDELNIQLYSSKENLKNNFLGIGPSFGVDSEWHVYKNINILGDVSTAFLWGRWNIRDTYHGPGALFSGIPETTISSNTHHSMLGTYMARGFLGLEWTFKATTLVKIKAGYEMQFWSNQLRLPVFQALPIHGDLTLQGATCGILIKF